MTIAIVKSAKWHMQVCICHLKWCDGERMNSTERDTPMRYSAAYPTGAERFEISRVEHVERVDCKG